MRTKTRPRTKAGSKASAKAKGKRYTAAEKKTVLDHVHEVNESRGRGGITSASKKFGVTALTISNWLKSNSIGYSVGRGPRAGGQASNTLRRLADLHDEIIKRERELEPLRKEFDKLKVNL